MARARTKQFESDAKALEYIGFLANTTRVDTSKWDLPKLFGEDNKSILRKPEEINERFFRFMNEAKAAQPEKKTQKVRIPTAVLKRAAKNMTPVRLQQKERQIKRAEEQIKTYTRSIANYEKASIKLKNELEELKGAWKKLKEAPAPDLKAAIQKLVDDGWYTSFKYQKGSLWCLTPEIIMTIPDQKQKYNLGRFAVKLTIKDFGVDVYPHEKNIFSGRYCHPYHNYGHALCFSGGGIEDARAEKDLYKFMSMFAALLQDGTGGIHHEPSRMTPNPEFQKNYYPKGK